MVIQSREKLIDLTSGKPQTAAKIFRYVPPSKKEAKKRIQN
jgi:hypothetical protein